MQRQVTNNESRHRLQQGDSMPHVHAAKKGLRLKLQQGTTTAQVNVRL